MAHIAVGEYDGESLKFDEPLPYPAHTRLVAALEPEPRPARTGRSWVAAARSLKLQGPTDLSVRLHEYLYGESGDGRE